MGMDVYGKSGNYFRAGAGSWGPIWAMVQQFVPESITSRVEYPWTNDGSGLVGKDARRAATILRVADGQGLIERYVSEYNAALDAEPNETCRWCEGTGVRRDKVGVNLGMPTKPNPHRPGLGWCNGCDGKGEHRPFHATLHMDLEHVRDFITFMAESDGFEIW